MAKKTTGRKDPKEYMKLAVQVMKDSIPERKKKNPSVTRPWAFAHGYVLPSLRDSGRHSDPIEAASASDRAFAGK